MISIEEFCSTHGAYSNLRDWSMANCQTMQEVLGEAPDSEWVVWIATRPGVLVDRELALFMCFCVRQMWHTMKNKRLRRVAEMAELFANGGATKKQMTDVLTAVLVANWSWAASVISVRSAANLARIAARSGSNALDMKASDSAWDGAIAAQAQWLRKNCKPNFD